MKPVIAYTVFIVSFFMLCSVILGRQIIKKNKVPPFTDENCIQAIVGEYAAEDDYYGMKLLAHAIRNRKTLKGVNGFYAKHVKSESKIVWENASLAWFDSLNEWDPLSGANEWRSTVDVMQYGQPSGFALVKICNGTFYYKPLK